VHLKYKQEILQRKTEQTLTCCWVISAW